MDASAVVEAFVQAWNEADVTARRQLLEQTWADDGVYADPDGTIEGRDALLADIAAFRERGTRVELTSGVDAYGRHFRFTWATRNAAGAVVKEGLDVGQLADDGRIMSIIAIFGPLP